MVLRLVTSAKTRWGLLRSRAEEDFGATAVEYALMLAFIAAVVIAGVTMLGSGHGCGILEGHVPPVSRRLAVDDLDAAGARRAPVVPVPRAVRS